jgi:hypothetical protein
MHKNPDSHVFESNNNRSHLRVKRKTSEGDASSRRRIAVSDGFENPASYRQRLGLVGKNHAPGCFEPFTSNRNGHPPRRTSTMTAFTGFGSIIVNKILAMHFFGVSLAPLEERELAAQAQTRFGHFSPIIMHSRRWRRPSASTHYFAVMVS